MAFWLMNAASISGYVIAALFLVIAIGRAVRNAVNVLAARMPRRSILKHYMLMLASLGFFCLLAIRGCYIASVVVDAEFRTAPAQIFAGK